MKTKKIGKLMLIMGFITLGLVSCKKEGGFFELENKPEFPWQTVNEFEMAVVYPYTRAFYHGWGGGFYGMDMMLYDAMSDIVWMVPRTSENYPQQEYYYRQTFSRSGRCDESFSASYKAINNINQALDFYYNKDQYRDSEGKHAFDDLNSTDQASLNRQLGELYFMRALAYYHLCMRHCPPPGTSGFSATNILPIREGWTFDADVLREPTLVSAKYVYDNIIIPDLQKSRSLLPWTTSGQHASYAFGRATKSAALLLSARVYFSYGPETGTDDGGVFWDSASVFCDEIINAGYYDLSEDPIKAFNRSDKSYAKEVIWECLSYDENTASTVKDNTLCSWNKYAALVNDPNDPNLFYNPNYELEPSEPGWISDSIYRVTHLSNRCGWHVYCFSLSTSYKIGWIEKISAIDTNGYFSDEAKNDKRFQQLYIPVSVKDPSLPALLQNSIIPEQKFSWVTKNNIWCHKWFRGQTGDYTNVPAMRLPEAYLTRAIIQFKKGNTNQALQDVNTVRARAGISNLSSITEDRIENEWIKEFAFEGHRLRYLFALKKPIGAGDREGVTDINFPYTELLNSDGGIWKLPIAETDFQ